MSVDAFHASVIDVLVTPFAVRVDGVEGGLRVPPANVAASCCSAGEALGVCGAAPMKTDALTADSPIAAPQADPSKRLWSGAMTRIRRLSGAVTPVRRATRPGLRT